MINYAVNTTIEQTGIEKMLVSISCVVLGFDKSNLMVLLQKRILKNGNEGWSLLYGMVKKEESMHEAADRIVEEIAGLKKAYNGQLYCFEDVNQDFLERVISIAHLYLIKISDDSYSSVKEGNIKWFNVQKLPAISLNHMQMITLAKKYLLQKINFPLVLIELLPEKFTLSELQNLYESIFEATFDKRNFRKKIVSNSIVRKLKEKEKLTSKKGSFYYTLNRN